ncbi:pepF/M3 family oligoendopeptidase [Paenibacillus rhizosphaerae]|uniref:PepF/M3 family oligoendopeptidase n=1 Tax=Paenibacillus rhizosphaerae TaxID=297318 RepID=A0A839TTD4_9BACL|nr:M3 family oligoendopeptidase [Paenibacillus rhizosphaerae]MBB3129773.1 pepF/M3 family oligoendopeptidase [Paenibacillus rhizosphaerae]
MNKDLKLTWNLESVFPGGSASAEFDTFLQSLEQDLKSLQGEIKAAKAPASLKETESFDGFIEALQGTIARLSEASAFVSCLQAQNQQDKKAVQLGGRLANLRALINGIMTDFDHILRSTDDETFAQWIGRDQVRQLAFVLSESRDQAREMMSPDMESLALDLAIDGYHGWSSMYDTIVSHIQIPFEENGETVSLSAGQAANKLDSPDKETRESMFVKWEQAWSDKADFCGDTLNHLGGFRLKLYGRRGWDEVLKEPLEINRMSREALDAMWNVIQDNKQMLLQYMERKAKLLGQDRLSWVDVEAPISKSSGTISYQEAAETIVEQFRKFSPRMADFAEMAFDKSWIEAEDRPGKRPGGFCTSLKLSKETRIFMTFSGTASNVSTLAHELGHGYHQHLMNELPILNQRYAMNVAETASTFAEMIVSDAMVKSAADEQEQLALLEDKIQRSVAFYMNIHARFLFETRFYEKRKNGLLSVQELNALMEEAQKEAYCEALSSYHPHFWASKLHFYITGVPFYNFPYTFGYMFSTGIYARALQEGAGFADKYNALLRDTGVMTVEELAKKHLNADLTGRDFWQSAADLTAEDVKQFLAMTDHLV